MSISGDNIKVDEVSRILFSKKYSGFEGNTIKVIGSNMQGRLVYFVMKDFNFAER